MTNENRLFRPQDVAWLADSRCWRLVSARASDDAPLENRTHRRWMARHSHRHPNVELLFVLEGETEQGLEGEVHSLRPRSVCFFAPMDEHDQGYRAGRSLRHLWINVLADHYIALVLTRHSRQPYRQMWREVLSVEQAGVLPGVFTRRHSEARPPADAICAAARVVVGSVIQRGAEPAIGHSAEALREEVIAAMRRHIEVTAGKDISLSALARIAGYSKFHFLRLFRRYTGVTVQQYIDRCRARRVEELAAEGRSQKAIGEALGFSHPAAFSRWKRTTSARQSHR
jgi:AraC-like DNA-binding protein